MDLFWNMATIQCELFIYLAIGYLCRKTKLIPSSAQQPFTNFLLYVPLPCMVVMSFNLTISPEQTQTAYLSLAVGLALCLGSVLVGHVLYRRSCSPQQRPVMQYGTLISNNAFIGLPIVARLYGTEGMFLASMMLIPYRIFVWTAGVSYYAKADWRTTMKKLLTNPGIIAVEVGLLRLVLNIPLPNALSQAMTTLGDSTTALSMIVIGALLGDIDLHHMVSKNVLYLIFIRHFGIPLLAMAIMNAFGMDPLLIAVAVILTGMPVGSTTALLAHQYGADYHFASKCVFVSTVLALFTVPVLMLFLG